MGDTTKTLPQNWLTVKLLAQAEPSFTPASLRNLVFNEPTARLRKALFVAMVLPNIFAGSAQKYW